MQEQNSVGTVHLPWRTAHMLYKKRKKSRRSAVYGALRRLRLVIDKWLRLGRRNSLFRRISSVQAEDSAVDELAVLHILQRDVRGAFRLLGRSGGAELRARHADLFERRGDGLLRLAEGVVQIAVRCAQQLA